MTEKPVVIIGAGIGGLACAIDLAAQGLPVMVVERAETSGGKMRETVLDQVRIDSGPTVFTMRWVFDALFEAAGTSLDSHLTLRPLEILARHAWNGSASFDLFADIHRAADAVGDFAGAAEARRFLTFCAEAKAIYRTLKEPFLAAPRPNPVSLSARIGLHRPGALLGIRPFDTMWSALSRHFHDPRLRQLFGRYATYNGSSPFLSPATLMLIAHVEQDGVWTIAGGMQRLADALENLARARGVVFRFGQQAESILLEKGRAAGVLLASGERLEAGAVVVNADAAALAQGLLGNAVADCVKPIPARNRSLSAVTWAMTARVSGFDLLHHNVFFSRDYRREFEQIFSQSRLPDAPTVYICAQDRDGRIPEQGERLFLLINAPANGDCTSFSPEEIATCQNRVFRLLEQCGLHLQPQAMHATTPADFHRLFPGTGGALYGRASHGWRASFQRPGSATRIPGLYLAGGSTHPGAGVPMAALSGRLAAQRLLWDRASTRPFHRVAISGGISTASAAMDALPSP
ncbi:MAG: 1-hydroxycarotenoid 3,4-desaturase CrtD [Rhizomicrobium sp.]